MASLQSPTLAKLMQAAGSLTNPEIDAWKKTGGKVIGYYCPFIPEELFIAAGFLPSRMRGVGSTGTELADAYFSDSNCCFVRNSFDQVLRGEYKFLDGVVIGTGCDHVRRIFDNAVHASVLPFIYLLDHPRTIGSTPAESEVIIKYYCEQLSKLRVALDGHFGICINDSDLQAAIVLCNKTRALQKQLYELSTVDSPLISAAERAAVMMAGASMPKAIYNNYLQQLLTEFGKATPVASKPATRLMLVGPAVEDPEFFALFDQINTSIVIDDCCFGARTVQGQVEEATFDPLMALAKYQVQDFPFCPKINGAHASRLEFVTEMIAKYRVVGVVAQGYVACDAWGCSYALLNIAMKKAGIPFLHIDREYVHSQAGQILTRLQAFTETIGGVL